MQPRTYGYNMKVVYFYSYSTSICCDCQWKQVLVSINGYTMYVLTRMMPLNVNQSFKMTMFTESIYLSPTWIKRVFLNFWVFAKDDYNVNVKIVCFACCYKLNPKASCNLLNVCMHMAYGGSINLKKSYVQKNYPLTHFRQKVQFIVIPY